MLFNTGAALLDAIVLAVVAREPEGTYGYKITQEVRQVIELSESTCIPCFGDYRRTNVWKSMTGNAVAERGVITKSPAEAGRSFIYMKVSGAATAIRSRDCLKEN